MNRISLLIVVPALLVALGFAQTPTASGNTDQVNIKGCLGGSEGSYTVAEDNTGTIFKITTSSTDLKAYVGQDVNLTGNKTGTAESSLAVTALNMISEHCATAAAAPAAAVSTPSDTVSTPPAAAAAPEATVSAPAGTTSTPVAAAPRGDCEHGGRDQRTSCSCRRSIHRCTLCDCQFACGGCQRTRSSGPSSPSATGSTIA